MPRSRCAGWALSVAINLVVVDDYPALCRVAAGAVRDACAALGPAPLAAFAVGATPEGLFRELAKHHCVALSCLHVAQLDEYLGLAESDHRLLAKWLKRDFLDPLEIGADRFIRFDSLAADPARDASRVERSIDARGGLDLAVLGLGPNGHIGFNEPGTPFDAPTRPVELTVDSVSSNAAYWGSRNAVPRRAITLGMSTLGLADRLILLVSGRRKSNILRRTLHGPIDPAVPATMLRTCDRVTVIADSAALGETTATTNE